MRLCKEVEDMCEQFVNKMMSEVIVPVRQDETKASYFPHVKSDEIVVYPEIMTYDEIHNRIRGLAPWQSTYLYYRGEYFKIFDYGEVKHYIKQNRSNLCLKTKDGKFVYFANLRAFGRFKKYFTSTILKNLH